MASEQATLTLPDGRTVHLSVLTDAAGAKFIDVGPLYGLTGALNPRTVTARGAALAAPTFVSSPPPESDAPQHSLAQYFIPDDALAAFCRHVRIRPWFHVHRELPVARHVHRWRQGAAAVSRLPHRAAGARGRPPGLARPPCPPAATRGCFRLVRKPSRSSWPRGRVRWPALSFRPRRPSTRPSLLPLQHLPGHVRRAALRRGALPLVLPPSAPLLHPPTQPARTGLLSERAAARWQLPARAHPLPSPAAARRTPLIRSHRMVNENLIRFFRGFNHDAPPMAIMRGPPLPRYPRGARPVGGAGGRPAAARPRSAACAAAQVRRHGSAVGILRLRRARDGPSAGIWVLRGSVV